MNQHVFTSLGLAAGLAACAFQPGGAAELAVDGDVVIAVDGAATDAAAPTIDGRGPDGATISVDAATPTEGVIRVAPLTAAGVVDGVGDELGSSLRYPLDLGGGGHRDLAAGYVPSMRAELRAGQDATYLYLLVEVTEAGTHFGDSASTWENDAVTFYFDTNDDRSGTFGADDHEVIIDVRPVYAIYPSTNGADPVMEAVRLDTTAGFSIEARFTKASLGNGANGRLGFSWGVYDDDAGGNAEGYGLWYELPATRCATCCLGEAHAEAWCDTTLLGELAFD